MGCLKCDRRGQGESIILKKGVVVICKSPQEPPPGFKRPNINLEEVLQQEAGEDGEPKVKAEKKSFKCEACASTFVSEGRWALHMQKHRGEPGVDVPG